MSAERKVAIIGFTESRLEAPWDDPSWEKWTCNNLHQFVDMSKITRSYDLHDKKTIMENPAHVAWLGTTTVPVYMWEPIPESPTSVRFPREEIIEKFGTYFTNSISLMIAHALLEGVTELGIWGVDMATGSEYAAQRPSCEFFIGIAMGAGVKVIIPNTSDLLKSSTIYGLQDDSPLRTKMEARKKELQQRMTEYQQQRAQAEAAIQQLTGAIQDTDYYLAVWTMPAGTRGGADPLASDGAGTKTEEVAVERQEHAHTA